MTTFANLVDDVLLLMQGYGLEGERAAFLTAAVTTTTQTTFTVDSTADLGPGLAEIGTELVWIKDASGTTVTIAPDGRGYRGTTAATYAVDKRITMNPVLPRALVKRKINESIVGTYPTLWGVGSATLTYDPVVANYEIPADVEDILQVTFQAVGPDESWPLVRRWRVDRHPDTTEFATGKSLYVWDGLDSGSSLRVVYQKRPQELSGDSDLLTDSGLSDTARAAIVAGAAWRLVSYMDASRLKVSTAEVDMMTDRVPMGAGVQIASYLRAQYERELREEQQRQAVGTVPVLHWEE